MFDPLWYITITIILFMLITIKVTPKSKRAGNTLPTVITSLGIFGTFLGIAIGLLGFDVGDPQNSIVQLLEGLKIAFITSIAGIIIAISLKCLYSLWVKQESEEGATADTLSTQLKEISEAIKAQHTDSVTHLKAIETSLVGDGETTLITQLQKLRTNLSDKLEEQREAIIKFQTAANQQAESQAQSQHEEMIKEFRNFAEKMADNNSKALIDALQKVIKDFNAKINEQFGENFKQLNEAVGKVLFLITNHINFLSIRYNCI